MDTIQKICDILGVPLALEIVEGPSITLSFLGIILDTCRIEARLPAEKLTRIQHTVADWLAKKKATKHEILSLVGQLQHATKVVLQGRIFVARMYSAAAKVPQLDFYTRLNLAFHSDLWWWHTFLRSWNGLVSCGGNQTTLFLATLYKQTPQGPGVVGHYLESYGYSGSGLQNGRPLV